MLLFGDGRNAFLEFLRNLSPQILLFAMVLILGRSFVPELDDSANVKRAVILFIFILLLVLAMMASVSKFVEEYLTAAKSLRGDFKDIKEVDNNYIKRIYRLVIRAGRYHKALLAETFILLVVILFSYVSVIFFALNMAVSVFLKTSGS
jgi:hypothetical protein